MNNEVFIARIGTNFYLHQGGVAPSGPFHTEKNIGDAKNRSRAWRRQGRRVINATPLAPEKFEGVIRKDNLLLHPDGKIFETHKSINAAKRRSRALQKEGTKVRVEHVERAAPPAPPPPIKVEYKPSKKKQTRYLRKTAKRRKTGHNWQLQAEGADDLN